MDENMDKSMDKSMDKNMYMYAKKKMVIGIVIGLFLGWLITWAVMMPKTGSGWQQPTTTTNTTTVSQGLNLKQLMVYQTMDKLWLEHVWWTREYLKATISNSKDTTMVAARLLKNQEDIGNSIKSVYGEAAGVQLTTLLKAHIEGAVDLVAAAKSGNQAKITVANTAWYANADQIASFLANANPSWNLSDLTSMMHTHLDLTKQEALDLIGKKYDASIMDFQKVEDEILMMSSSLSQGVIKQFPGSF